MGINDPLAGLSSGLKMTRRGSGAETLEKLDALNQFRPAEIKVRKDQLDRLRENAVAAKVNLGPAIPLVSKTLDADQKQVAWAGAETIRVVAPAGSGKTHTMLHRVLAQAAERREDPGRFLILTFDRSARSSLNEKLAELMGQAGAASLPGSPLIRTLNSFGYNVLKEHFGTEFKALVDGRRRWWMIRNARDKLREIAPELAERFPGYIKEQFFAELYGLLKNQAIDPRDPDCGDAVADFLLGWKKALVLFSDPDDEDAVNETLTAIVWLFQAHELLLADANLMDFDDQKLRAFQCLREHAGTLRLIQRRFVEVIVDEFQDINKLDFELIKLIAADARLVVTGDDDQAIYGFRGCSPEYIMWLDKYIERPLEPVELRTNYRCPPNIVQHADRLIRHNVERIPKSPIAHRTDPAPIRVDASPGAGIEARWMVEYIRKVRSGNPSLAFRDFAILYRMNAQSLPIQIELILAHMPYRIRPEHDILVGDELEWLLGILRIKLALERHTPFRPEDGTSVIKGYFRYVDRKVEDRLFAYFGENRDDFLGAIRSPRFADILPKAAQGNFRATIQGLPYNDDLGKTFQYISTRFDGLKGMVSSLEDLAESGDLNPLAEIFEVAANHPGTIDDFVDLMVKARTRAAALNSGGDERDAVDLLTYFGAKGRQWHTVIMASCNEMIIPIRHAIRDGEVEQERRLFYVGMTRASSNLVVSYLERSVNTVVAPSRFLYESGLLADAEAGTEAK
ncbi:MAG TPA: ATP-dependent helicase [Thermomicrobiales bacterium]|nr:ATP-dependent helicase [Thermomicrobiales bacterium]